MLETITGYTKLICLLGSPVAHSISPAMHNEAFRQLGLDYTYLAFDVGIEKLKSAVEGLKTLGVKGFNLTMPDKNKICELVDSLSPAAQLANSVNTVVNENGKLIGYTTDGIGYMKAAEDAGYPLVGKKVTILGAGGAATAICVQAALDGVKEIFVFKRNNSTFMKTQHFIDKLNKNTNCRLSLYDLEDNSILNQCIKESDILINATSVGMAPFTQECVLRDTSILSPDLVVSDVIYNPKETKLLSIAKEKGCKTFNGLYMLLYQGAEAFRLWTGQQMPVSIIKEKYFSDAIK